MPSSEIQTPGSSLPVSVTSLSERCRMILGGGTDVRLGRLLRVETGTPLVVLVDDLRSFRDGRPAVVLRTSAEALAFLRDVGSGRVEELWLDHDLGGEDTIRPVALYLEERAFRSEAVDVGVVYVHSANPPAAESVLQGLRRYGYTALRSNTDDLLSAPLPPA